MSATPVPIPAPRTQTTPTRVPTQSGTADTPAVPSSNTDTTPRRRIHAPAEPVAAATATEVPVDEAPDVPADRPAVEPTAHRDQTRRIAIIGELVGIAMLVLVLASAVFIARYDASGLVVDVPAMAAWAVGGALVGLPLAAVLASTRPWVVRSRTPLGVFLLGCELGCLTGLVASAGGIAGPFWLVFLPLVLLTAAVVSVEAGVVVGAVASGGIYVASAVSHTLDGASIGQLLVILPMLPVAGYVGAAVGSAARRAADDARVDRASLERDLVELQALLDEVALGDLTAVPSVRADAHPAASTLAVALSDSVVALRRLVRGISGGSEEIAAASSSLLGSAEGLAAGAVQQSSSVTEVTATVDQLAAMSNQIAETAQAVSRYAAETLRYADEGEVAVVASAQTMDVIAGKVDAIATRADLLAERTEQIGKILRVIDDIASQTNMLAFNAAIEAARAGGQGKGFAVVASEIRKLAERARESTHRVEEIVQEIRLETERTRDASAAGAAEVRIGAELTRGVVEALERITVMVDETTAAAREISVVTDQQRAASGQVAGAMTQVTEVSERYRDASRRAADAAGRLDGLSGELRAACARFKIA